MKRRFVKRWLVTAVRPAPGTLLVEYVVHAVSRAKAVALWKAAGLPNVFVSTTPDGYWDREMNDICSVFERSARMNESRPPVDRFAGLHPTKTEPSTFDHVSCGYDGYAPMTPAKYKRGLARTLKKLGFKLDQDELAPTPHRPF